MPQRPLVALVLVALLSGCADFEPVSREECPYALVSASLPLPPAPITDSESGACVTASLTDTNIVALSCSEVADDETCGEKVAKHPAGCAAGQFYRGVPCETFQEIRGVYWKR